MFRSRMLAAALGVCAVAVAASSAPAQEPFYKGKRLTLLVNFDAGSATDIEARVFARHFVKHIDGAPQLIIQNMAGGGGVNGTMYLGEVAPKDGTDGGLSSPPPPGTSPAEPERFRVDFKTYEFIGYQPAAPPSTTCARTCRPASSKPTDIVKAQGPRLGRRRADTGRDISDPARRSTCSACRSGTSPAIAAASARGSRCSASEIHLYADTTPGYRGAVEPTLVKDGTVIPLWYDPQLGRQDLRQVEAGRGPADRGLSTRSTRRSSARCRPARMWEAYLALITIERRDAAACCRCRRARRRPRSRRCARRSSASTTTRSFTPRRRKTLGFVPEYDAGPDTRPRSAQRADGAARDQDVRRRLHQEREQVADDRASRRRR